MSCEELLLSLLSTFKGSGVLLAEELLSLDLLLQQRVIAQILKPAATIDPTPIPIF
ncbi:MAG: hypothetical protein LE179_05830 [Endomicrobium sp.]|jgi:hypothetical protein|nr:hypothetical protein [Endomicrobium sp.]